MPSPMFHCIYCNHVLTHATDSWHCASCSRHFPVTNGVHRFIPDNLEPSERQTVDFYSDMWAGGEAANDPRLIRSVLATYAIWFGIESADGLKPYFQGKKVLNAGAGSSLAEYVFVDQPELLYALDLSKTVNAIANHWKDRTNHVTVQASIMQLPFPDEYMDAVLTTGVLHHTRDTFLALKECVRTLKRGGTILFYVYRRKSPVREFADDYVRGTLATMSSQEKWEALRPLTKLGRSLKSTHVELTIEEDIPALGIKAGKISLHDLVHWHLLGCFWDDGYALEENNRVNVDWYAPTHSRRHSPEEVRQWLFQLSLKAKRFTVTGNGIAVIAERT